MKMPEQLEKMMFGFVESQTLFVANEIKLFDYLAENGPSDCHKIAQALGLPASSLERLLICAVCIKLLQKNGNNYNVTSESQPFLSRKSPNYCGGKFKHYWQTSYKIFEHLLSAVKEDKPQWSKLAKNEAADEALDAVYRHAIYSDEKSTKEFLETMWASGYNDSIELCQQFSLADYTKLIDLGGATGSFAIAALQNNEKLRAEIFDFLQVKPYAEAKFREYDMHNRVVFTIGDMFKDALPKGDVYAIGYVLSDWPEELCLSLIQKVYNALPANGLLIILEKFFNEDKTGPYLTAMLNITMLLEMHGKHRSISEYQRWLQNTGFTDFQVVRSSGEKHMIIGKKI
jgi:hypothetical protein